LQSGYRSGQLPLKRVFDRYHLKNIMRKFSAAFVLISTLMVCLAGTGCRTAPSAFSNWPAGKSPEEVGKRVAENFAARQLNYETNPKRAYVIYPEVCAWYGSLEVAKLTHDNNLKERLIRKFNPLLGPEAKRISPEAHVDYRVFGAVPLEIYLLTKDTGYLTIGKNLADQQWENPTEDGITREARYWVDDMYMINAVQVQAYRATGDKVYLDRAALATATYLDKLQQPNGLFFHAADSPFYWARGNGWYARIAQRTSTRPPQTRTHHDRLQNHDGCAAQISERARSLAAVDRQTGIVAGNLRHRNVRLRNGDRREARLARRTNLRLRSTQSLAGARR
jgi:rhamnogalacturonyl hydrolase YesR